MKETEKLLSVIIPCYNTDKYVLRAVHSVSSQPCAESIERIVVDDGSWDRSAVLCDAECMTDSDMVVIHQRNSGVAAARNRAIEKAMGKYVGFLDADDWWHKDFFTESMSSEFVFQSEDIYSFSYTVCTSDYRYKKENSVLSSDEIQRLRFDTCGFERYNWFHPCSFFYATSFLRKNNLRYLPVRINEDQPFVVACFYLVKKVTKINRKLFVYWSNTDSCLHTVDYKDYFTEKAKSLSVTQEWYRNHNVAYEPTAELFFIAKEILPQMCALNTYSVAKNFFNSFTDIFDISSYRKFGLSPALYKTIHDYVERPFRYWVKCKILVLPNIKLKQFLYIHPRIRKPFDFLNYRILRKYQKNTEIPDGQ